MDALLRHAYPASEPTQDYQIATAMVGRFPDQSISLFDAALATMATRLRLPVWTYDHHFDVMQAAVWR